MTTLLLPLALHNVSAAWTQALQQAGVPCVLADDVAAADLPRFVLFDSQRGAWPNLQPRQQAIDLSALPGEDCSPRLSEGLLDQSCLRKSFALGSLLPTERVATFDKRHVRTQLLASLRGELERRGGLWLTLAPVPAPYQSAFCLRVDYDEVAPADVERFLAAIGGHERATSHYLCASAYASQREVLARLQGMHVGGHGFWHHTYVHRSENLANIRRGLDALRAAGMQPDGFVAPHGRFNAGLLWALEESGQSHSSEFSLACDDRPFAPRRRDGSCSPVLQVPVHPISLGVLLESAAATGAGEGGAVKTAIEHFVGWLAASHAAGEPAFFYGHPERRLGRYPEVVRELFRAADALPQLWQTNLAEFTAWWRARARWNVRVSQTQAEWVIQSAGPEGPWLPAVELWRGDQVATVPLVAAEIRAVDPKSSRETYPSVSRPGKRSTRSLELLHELQFVTRSVPPRLLGEPVSPAFTFRGLVRELIDWEYDTPREDIRVYGLRQLLKKSLRYALRPPAAGPAA